MHQSVTEICFTRDTGASSTWVTGIILLNLAPRQVGRSKNLERRGQGNVSVGAGWVTHRQTYPLHAPAAASTGTRDKSGFTLEGKSNKESPLTNTATGYWKPQFTNQIHSCHRRSWTYNWTQWPIDRRPPTHPHDSLLTTAHPRTSRGQWGSQNASTL